MKRTCEKSIDLLAVLQVSHPLAFKVTHQQVDAANVCSHPFESNNQREHCFRVSFHKDNLAAKCGDTRSKGLCKAKQHGLGCRAKANGHSQYDPSMVKEVDPVYNGIRSALAHFDPKCAVPALPQSV